MDMLTSISSKTLPFDGHDNMGVYGDASFSSYLNGKDDSFIRKLSKSTPQLNPNSIIPTTGGAEDGEIGVFGAEKYFNGGMDEEEGSKRSTSSGGTRKPSTDQSKKVDKLAVGRHHHHHSKPWLGTPSVGSESSSINSQRPLLKIVKSTTAAAAAATPTTTTTSSNFIHSKSNHFTGNKKCVEETASASKSFLSTTLGYCVCYSCKDKHCVDVGEISFSNAVLTKPRNINNNNITKCVEESESFRENHFSFPTGSLLMSPPVKVVDNFRQEGDEVERKSLEVFGSPVMGRLIRNYKPMSLEKRVAMLSWDQTHNDSGGVIYNEDEVNSDCSSDLFEIESLTKQAASSLLQSPTTCYAPSEVSVEWSVATASALDFDFDEHRPSLSSPARLLNLNKLEVEVVQKRRSSSLLGCKSEKAVRVAEDKNNARKTTAAKSNSNSDHLLRNSESSVPMKRFDAGGFSFRSQGPPLPPPPHRALATRSLPRPYSPRLSNISFNIH